MDQKITMEITNDRLEEAIREYVKEPSKELLSNVLNLLRPTKLIVPAMLKAPDKPIPCFIRSNDGDQYLVVYTSREQMPKEPQSQAILNMPFPECNKIVVTPEFKLKGMVLNPFSDNLILKKELVEKLHEADEKAANAKQVQMTPEQFNVFIKRQVEFGLLPKRLFDEGEAFIEKLCDEKEALINRIFADAYKQPGLNPYTEQDYSVMALDIAEDLTLIRVDLPESGMVPPLCYRIYMTFNPKTKKAGYYTIEMTSEQGVHLLGRMDENGKHSDYGNAPVEGAELQRIIDLAGSGDAELTS